MVSGCPSLCFQQHSGFVPSFSNLRLWLHRVLSPRRVRCKEARILPLLRTFCAQIGFVLGSFWVRSSKRFLCFQVLLSFVPTIFHFFYFAPSLDPPVCRPQHSQPSCRLSLATMFKLWRSDNVDFLTLSFVFIHIPGLFPRFWCSVDRRVCGPRPVPPTMEEPQTAKPAVCATRRFVIMLCFHRHSRIVPLILS